jgi:hypothetical protein
LLLLLANALTAAMPALLPLLLLLLQLQSFSMLWQLLQLLCGRVLWGSRSRAAICRFSSTCIAAVTAAAAGQCCLPETQ